jgi:tRNA A37 threonylcarbamoyladenosine dehydratase
VRETAKIDYIMKTSVDILKVIETNLHKRKKKIEENEVMSVYSNEDL